MKKTLKITLEFLLQNKNSDDWTQVEVNLINLIEHYLACGIDKELIIGVLSDIHASIDVPKFVFLDDALGNNKMREEAYHEYIHDDVNRKHDVTGNLLDWLYGYAYA